jgi:hypothetical protein
MNSITEVIYAPWDSNLAGSGGKPWKKGASKLENDACEMFDH